MYLCSQGQVGPGKAVYHTGFVGVAINDAASDKLTSVVRSLNRVLVWAEDNRSVSVKLKSQVNLSRGDGGKT